MEVMESVAGLSAYHAALSYQWYHCQASAQPVRRSIYAAEDVLLRKYVSLMLTTEPNPVFRQLDPAGRPPLRSRGETSNAVCSPNLFRENC